MNPPRIGLTGGIGCGKSIVARIFQTLGIPVFNADAEAKQIYNSDTAKQFVVSEICFDAIDANTGEINRRRVAEEVFANPQKLQKLNAFVHPWVFAQFNTWAIQHANAPYLMMESAILFENNLDKHFDYLISVIAPYPIVLQRVLLRDATSEAEVKARIANQMSNEERVARSQFVITNDDLRAVMPQVLSIHRQLSAKDSIK